jgi:YidC/Oxa1 family membrane protein insertase
MNMRDLVLPISLAFVSVILLNHFFPSNSSKESAESTFIAPREKKEYRPLNVEIDFYDQKRAAHTQLTDCETEWGHLSFSTDGASLDSVDFKRESDGRITTVRTVFPVADGRENRCFLVALQNATPFYYTLLSQEESDNSYELLYVAGNEECVVQKLFTIDKHNPKIDLSIEIAPKSGHHDKIEPRILFPAPVMPDLKGTDVISSIVIDQNDVFAKTYLNKLDVHRGWFKPIMFGTDDRYFIHALIADNHHFAQRAYYKVDDQTHLLSIVEGPTVTEKASWTLSFYFGPKELNAIAAVDTRLEKTLEYSGMLSFLAKLMLHILNWLYKYVHNYGLAIILLTLLIQLCLLPLTLRNGEEKFKKQQAEYQRELAHIEQRFAGDQERLLAERTALIRRKGVPGLGCLLPLLLQIPIFFALSRVLSSSFELYKAPMLWIPDLSSRDPYFILPVLVIIAMLIQDTSGNPQQRMSKITMAFVFGAFTSSFSAGLTLYILMGRVFGFIQTRLMHFFKLV